MSDVAGESKRLAEMSDRGRHEIERRRRPLKLDRFMVFDSNIFAI